MYDQLSTSRILNNSWSISRSKVSRILGFLFYFFIEECRTISGTTSFRTEDGNVLKQIRKTPHSGSFHALAGVACKISYGDIGWVM